MNYDNLVNSYDYQVYQSERQSDDYDDPASISSDSWACYEVSEQQKVVQDY